VFNIKLDHGLSEVSYDRIVEWTRSILFEGNRLKENFYTTRSMMKPLGLGYQKNCKGYSCHQRLLSIWNDANHMMRWMKWWCTFSIVKPGNTLTMCFLSFQWRQGTCIMSYVQMNSIYLGHLLLFILVGRWYSRVTTCH
jgi:hypothetical protein